MRTSISITDFSWPSGPKNLANELARTARAADDAGLYAVWLADHLIQMMPGRDRDSEMLETYTTLGYLAGQTTHVQLGAMVSPVSFREPAILIKSVTTLDVLSGGRAWFGIGAGYQADEAAAMGLPLPPTGERFDRLEETLQLALQMWRGDTSAFHGTHYRLEEPINSPGSLRSPHPPIIVGGTGEHRTLRLVAQYADACNVFDIPDGGKTVKHKLDVLAKHCDDLGRPYDEISKTISTRLGADESAQQFADRCGAFAEWGIDHVMVIVQGTWTDQYVHTLGEAAALD
jgi:F420-dependent oxidoreductase-like protein